MGTISTGEMTWFTAEGMHESKPVLYRGRNIPEACVGYVGFPTLLVAMYRYETTDETGLPSLEQYSLIDHFESLSVNTIEALGLGLLAFVMTSSGVVRYFFYVEDVKRATSILRGSASTDQVIEFVQRVDERWAEFRLFLNGMSGSQ